MKKLLRASAIWRNSTAPTGSVTTEIELQQGSLCPALHRLERRGWVKAKWAISESNRSAKYYELTSKGRKQLEAETVHWRKLTDAAGHILDMY